MRGTVAEAGEGGRPVRESCGRVISSLVCALDCLINVRQKGGEKRRPIPDRRQIARDVRAVWRKKRTSLLVAAARYKSFTSMVSTVFYHLTFVAGKLVSAVYCLCTGNDISIYALISKAAVLEVDLKPDSIICDFETVPIHAIQAVQGCYFHFCQAVHRKVSELELRARYRNDGETKGKSKCSWSPLFPQYSKFIRLLACLKQALRHMRFYELLKLLITEQGVVEMLISCLVSPDPAAVREGRAYNLKRTNMEDKHWVCRQVKKGCWSSMHTNLKVDTSSLIFCSSCR
ncbi:hypothetical protein T4C_1402 [Trichinella pseudospiralis]|uniref:MULE transposase domain-containing protein n=1 Tax=Trichinella pseudospiralis TaxID=6337 RepID=A0A0V1IVB8_TRIPS|nr:hypothetical protein T4C_1402 [Trichinella pseudospiralis]